MTVWMLICKQIIFQKINMLTSNPQISVKTENSIELCRLKIFHVHSTHNNDLLPKIIEIIILEKTLLQLRVKLTRKHS